MTRKTRARILELERKLTYLEGWVTIHQNVLMRQGARLQAPVPMTVEGVPLAARDTRPHSRACGWQAHPHGTACSTNCPTCHGLDENVDR